MCMSVCVHERVRVRECVRVHVRVRAHVRVCFWHALRVTSTMY